MAHLVDTSVLSRLANTADAQFAVAARAVSELNLRGEVLHITSQTFVEFRNMATRPVAVNGLGLTAVEAEVKAAIFESAFPLLPETPDIFPAWKTLVQALGVIGKQVHYARLVSVCHVHGVSHLLTFNIAHFTRLAVFGPGVTGRRSCDRVIWFPPADFGDRVDSIRHFRDPRIVRDSGHAADGNQCCGTKFLTTLTHRSTRYMGQFLCHIVTEENPPSTTIFCPVTNPDARDDASQTTTPANSCASPNRPIGV